MLPIVTVTVVAKAEASGSSKAARSTKQRVESFIADAEKVKAKFEKVVDKALTSTVPNSLSLKLTPRKLFQFDRPVKKATV
ncbi:hypothetical protein GCM10027044_16310 [Hymenobacter ruber]